MFAHSAQPPATAGPRRDLNILKPSEGRSEACDFFIDLYEFTS